MALSPVKQWKTPRTSPRILKHAEGIVGGFTRMDDDRAIELEGERDLRLEHLTLDRRRGEIVVVVETDFADRARVEATPVRSADARRVGGPAGERGRVVRVHAGSEPDASPGFPHPRRATGFLLVSRRQHAQRSRHAGLSGPLNHRVEIAGERLVGEVTMRINHRMREPGGTSPSKATSVGLPPSGLAARIMPFDSMPISLAGFKLNTTPTVRPTSCSGS